VIKHIIVLVNIVKVCRLLRLCLIVVVMVASSSCFTVALAGSTVLTLHIFITSAVAGLLFQLVIL